MATSAIYSTYIFFLFLLIHCLVWNLSRNQKLGLYQIFLVMLSTLFIMLIFNNIFFQFDLDTYLTVSLYFALSVLYLHFYVGITRSVSIRMLGELFQAQGHKMTYTKLENVYSMEFMLEHRLTTLVDHGWLKTDGTYYQCTKKGALIAKSQLLMKALYLIEQTG
jgi:hypothetical protein